MIDQKRDNIDLLHIKIFLGFLTSVVAVIILQQLKDIFIPLCMSLILYFFFNGVVKRLVIFRIPLGLVLLFLLIFIFMVMYFFGVLIYSSVSSFLVKFPTYTDRITESINALVSQLDKLPFLSKYIKNIDWTKSFNANSITAIISSTLGSFASLIGSLVLILIILMFMLAGRTALSGRLVKAFNRERSNKINDMINSIEDEVQHYLIIKTIVCAITSIICGVILFIAGFDFVVLSALLIFVLHFIPNFGSIIATLFPLSIGILKYGFSLRWFLVAICLMMAQFTIGNILEPKITGRSLNLSPIVILVSLIFWGYIWGIIGMMLAVPLTSALKIYFRNIPTLRPLAELISAE